MRLLLAALFAASPAAAYDRGLIATAEAKAEVRDIKVRLFGQDRHPGRQTLDCRMKTGTEVEAVRVEQEVLVEVKVKAEASARARCETQEDDQDDDSSATTEDMEDFHETVVVAQVSADVLRRHGYAATGAGGCAVTAQDGPVLTEAQAIAVVRMVQGLEGMKAAAVEKAAQGQPAHPAPTGPGEDHKILRFDGPPRD